MPIARSCLVREPGCGSIAYLALWVAVACSEGPPPPEEPPLHEQAAVNPQPDPPSNFPGPGVDASNLTLDVTESGTGTDGTPGTRQALLGGSVGAVEAGRGEVWLWDWNGTAPALTTTLREDGSFGPVDWTARAAGPVRVQARSEAGRGQPIDVSLGVSPTPVERPLDDCVDLPLEVAVPDLATLELGNVCTEPFTLVSAELRAPAGYAIALLEFPLIVNGGASTTLSLSTAPADAGAPAEELLLLEIGADAEETFRWAITVHPGAE